MAQTKDMTRGKPAGLIFFFALPLMLGNIFQQLYIVVDTAVVGQVAGVEALAALGAAEWLNWLVGGIVTGFTQGFSILIAQRFGAGDAEGLRRSAGLSLTLTGGITVLTTIVGLVTIRPILQLMNTPANIIDDAVRYLQVITSCLVINAAYNAFACILRAVGNSKTPLIAMLTAAAVNVALDFLFVLGMGMGVVGAALGTVLAQAAAAAICFAAVRQIPQLKFSRQDFIPKGGMPRQLLMLGLPVAFQNTIISIGGLVVQYMVNGFGFLYVAGFTATNKLYGLLEVAASSYGFAIATYAGQNLGAARIDRIRRGIRASVIMALGTALLIAAGVLVFGRALLSLFISGTPEETAEVLKIAYHYLAIMAAGLPVLYLLYVYRSALQGMGNTLIPMLSGAAELFFRVSVVLTLPRFIGDEGLFYAEPAAWIGATLLLSISYYVCIRREEKAAAGQSGNFGGE